MNNNRRKNGRRNAEFTKDSFSKNLESTIQNGVQNDYLINVQYYSVEKGLTERNVEPMDIVMRNGKKHLVGWCHLRNDWRTFRLDRIVQVIVKLQEKFEPREDYNRADYEDADQRYNDSLNSDLPYSNDTVKTMSENKLNFDSDNVKKYSDDEEDLSL